MAGGARATVNWIEENRSREKKMRRRGFTLLETLLAVVLVALMVTTIGYNYYRSSDRTVLRSAGYRLLNMARYARLTAGQKHRSCKLQVNLSTGRYWLTEQQLGIAVGEGAAESADEEQVIGDIYARPSRLPEGVRFKLVQAEGMNAVSGGAAAIEFNADGTAQAGLIQIGKGKKTYTLMIYPWTGRAELLGREVNELPTEITDLDRAKAAGAMIYR